MLKSNITRYGRTIIAPLVLDPNMSSTNHGYKQTNLDSDTPLLPIFSNKKRNKQPNQTLQVEESDYIDIRWDDNKSYSTTVLEVLPSNQIYVCYDDGEFYIEDINNIEIESISKNPPTDDLFFTDNHHNYHIPAGKRKVIKTPITALFLDQEIFENSDQELLNLENDDFFDTEMPPDDLTEESYKSLRFNQ